MYRFAKQWSLLAILLLSFTTLALTQESPEHTPRQSTPEAVYHQPSPKAVRQSGIVIAPTSSIARPEDAGLFAHTNIKLFVPEGKTLGTITPENTFAEYPSSLACVYHQGPQYAGCTPGNFTADVASAGGWGAIALVDAYHYSTANSDLAYFSNYFGIHWVGNFKVVEANSSFGELGGLTASCSGTPSSAKVAGWDVEEALDIEWSHAMAPNAKIILVEACSNSLNDLLYAEAVAAAEVTSVGGGDISNSWGTGEFASQVGPGGDDFFFRYGYDNITYFASAGDSGWGAQYPSSSPWVVSAGGTTINRDSSGNFLSESCWSGSGGGVSAYELWQTPNNIENGMGSWANYQYPFAGQGPRQTPDASFDADPNSGVYVYDTDNATPGWFIVGGTSVASPALAGIINASNSRMGQAPAAGGFYTNQENGLIYDQLLSYNSYFQDAHWYDVTTGSNGPSSNAGPGYDQCTGIGSPRGRLGK